MAIKYNFNGTQVRNRLQVILFSRFSTLFVMDNVWYLHFTLQESLSVFIEARTGAKNQQV